MTLLRSTYDEPEADSQWNVPKTVIQVFGVMLGYLVILSTMLSLLEPQGLGWTLATAATGLGVGTVAFLLFKRASQRGLTPSRQ